MKPWELREWLSLFYAAYHKELVAAQHVVDQNQWLLVTNLDLLNNPLETWFKIANYCELTLTADVESFATSWKQAQQYVVDEFELLDKIVEDSINNVDFDWQPINIVAEAIVQQRFRALGFEIRCDGLDTFPTDAKILHSLLDKVSQ